MEIKTLTSAESRKKEKIKAEYAQIIVSQAFDKPCYEILYFDTADNRWHGGFGSFRLEYVKEWLEEEFEPGYKSIGTAIVDMALRAEEVEAANNQLDETVSTLMNSNKKLFDALREAQARANAAEKERDTYKVALQNWHEGE